MARQPGHLRDGVIAGMIGAAIVAVWFLIYDAARGRPFRTPALLGAAVRGVQEPALVPSTPGPVVHYTVLHGVVFALVGVLIAYLIAAAQRRPAFHLVLFIGLGCFEVALLAAIARVVPALLTEIAWWAILVANALAAAGMVVYLVARQGRLAWTRLVQSPWCRPAREGVVAGLLGAVVVALWFLVHDLAAGAPLRTPALLGAALFHGLRDVHALQITLPPIGEYTLVHGAALLAFGWVAAVLLDLADREPRLLFLFVLLFCCFEVFFAALVAITAEWLLESLAWWTILMGNLLAALAMLAFFFRGHRVAWHRFLSARE